MGQWFAELWTNLWMLICGAIYNFIGFLYEIFEKVASVNLFSTDVFNQITGRIYLIIAIAMLFIFAYNIILAIVNPDGKDKGTSQMVKMIKETIISLVLIILLPTIFNYMYVLQTHILESNIIGTVVLGSVGGTGAQKDTNGDGTINALDCESGDYDCSCDFSGFNVNNYNIPKKVLFFFNTTGTRDYTGTMQKWCNSYKNLKASTRGGWSIAPTIFSAFYRPTNFNFNQCVDYLRTGNTSVISSENDKKICTNYFVDITMAKYSGQVLFFSTDSYLSKLAAADNGMEFDWLWATVAGVLAIYMFFCYAMEVGVRVAKLGFLQLISPIPVMMRIVPGQKEKIYDKWFNHLKNAYLDVFIRLAIIYFALFAISLVPEVIEITMVNSVWSDTDSISSFVINLLVQVFVILGILKFAQEAPALFKEFFGGNGGSFALRSPAKQLQENKLAKGAIGAMGSTGLVLGKNAYDGFKKGGVAGAAKTLFTPRAFSQTIGSARTGFKYGSQADSIDKMRDYTYSAAVEQMTKAKFKEKLSEDISKWATPFNNYFDTNYAPFNSPAALANADKLDKVSAALEKLEKKLDGTDPVKAVEQYYKALKESITDSTKSIPGGSYTYTDKDGRDVTVDRAYLDANPNKITDVLVAIEKELKAKRGEARGKGYDLKKDDEDFKAAILEYREAVTKNLDLVNEALVANGKGQITNVSVELDDAHIISNYKDVRDAGDTSKKHAEHLRAQAVKQQELKDNK